MELSNVRKIFSENVGYWVDYPPDPDVKLKIRPLYPEKAKEITTKSTKSGSGMKFDEINELTIDYIIEDWRGITFHGKPECTLEAKLELQKLCSGIADFVMMKSKEFAEDISLGREERLKNLKTLSSESLIPQT